MDTPLAATILRFLADRNARPLLPFPPIFLGSVIRVMLCSCLYGIVSRNTYNTTTPESNVSLLWGYFLGFPHSGGITPARGVVPLQKDCVWSLHCLHPAPRPAFP